MSFTTPVFVPLVEGLNLSLDSTLGKGELRVAENVDFSVQGQVRGRPGRGTPVQVVARTSDVDAAPTYLAAADFDATGFTALGLMRHRDGAGERPVLGCAGRLFGLEDNLWRDFGHFSCGRVERAHQVYAHEDDAVTRPLVGPDFALTNSVSGDDEVALLSPDTMGFEKVVTLSTTPALAGGAARCGNVTATVYEDSSGNVHLVTRTDGGSTLTDTIIANDADTTDNTTAGSAPSICCDFDETAFFVAYVAAGLGGSPVVMRVTTAGVVSGTFTGTALGVATNGIWVANSAVATNRVLMAFSAPTGVKVHIVDATTMLDTGVSATLDTDDCREVVIGVETSTRAWVAYRNSTDNALTIAVLNYSNGEYGTALQYLGGTTAGSKYHTPMHQPVLVDGRMYLTVANALYPWDTDIETTGAAVGTWFTIDLSNVTATIGGGTPGTLFTEGPWSRPTLVARGALDGTSHALGTSGSPSFQPESAVVWDDGSWTFPSTEWTAYQTMATNNGNGAVGTFEMGLKPITVVNRVRLQGPRAVTAGGATLFSGSVPHALAGDQCYEAGFPAGRPFVMAQVDGGDGTLSTAGDYTIYVVWAYTDGAGQVHRSNATAFTQTLSAGDALDLWLESPWFSERPAGFLRYEIYSTGPDPATDDPAYLQAVVTPSLASGSTTHKLWSTVASEELANDTATLYISSGEFLHFTPQADGGIAALGRRVWVASTDTVYASLLLQPREGVTWNDEGSLSISLPAGAGRIVALEGLDDKLLIFCERGVFMTQDSGPNNVGDGPDLPFPIRLTDLGCAGPRSTCVTDRGVVFCSPLDSTDPQRGGPWLLDRSLSLTERKYLGVPALDYVLGDGSWVPEVAFSPERQQLYMSIPAANEDDETGVLVIDFRAEKWATWAHQEVTQGALRSIDVVDGCLWTLGDRPAGFTEAPGTDGEGGGYSMRVKTSHLAGNGVDGLGWARVRAVTALAAPEAGAHDLTYTAVQDQTFETTSGAITLVAPTADTTWPTSRQAPEWRLPNQKCSSIQVELLAAPARARWTAIRLDVQPLPRKAPAKQRS